MVAVGAELIGGQPSGDEQGIQPLADTTLHVGADAVADTQDVGICQTLVQRGQTAARKVIDRG